MNDIEILREALDICDPHGECHCDRDRNCLCSEKEDAVRKARAALDRMDELFAPIPDEECERIARDCVAAFKSHDAKVIKAALEEAIMVAETWSLDPRNCEIAERYSKVGGPSHAVAAVLQVHITNALRALIDKEKP